jgi:putative membrane protein
MSYSTPPPPPPSPNAGTSLGTIKTYITLAFIFNIIFVIVWALWGIYDLILFATAASVFSYFGAGYVAGVFLIPGIVLLVFLAIGLIVFLRVWKMYKAVNVGDIATLKATSNMIWAILALIFAGVIPGIMLIISDGPIKQL